jgi:hypothetical protein
VLPLSPEALGITVSFCEHLRLKNSYEAVFEGFWNGTVLKVAHGMIPVCMEFMHVLTALRPLTAGYEYNGGSDASPDASPDASQDVQHTLFSIVERACRATATCTLLNRLRITLKTTSICYIKSLRQLQ